MSNVGLIAHLAATPTETRQVSNINLDLFTWNSINQQLMRGNINQKPSQRSINVFEVFSDSCFVKCKKKKKSLSQVYFNQMGWVGLELRYL